MDYEVSVQAIDYLANMHKNSKFNKLSMLKLLFFAERYHLRKYGRMITDDTFFAMPMGPVASGAKDILDNVGTLEDKYSHNLIKPITDYMYSSNKKLTEDDYDCLSETDKESLRFAYETFGYLSHSQLVNATHKYPEWKKFEREFALGETRRENIDINDFFSDLISEDDPYKIISKEHVDLSREMFNTGF